MITRTLLFAGFGFMTLLGSVGLSLTPHRRTGTMCLFSVILGFSGLLFLNGRSFVALNLAGFFGLNVAVLFFASLENTAEKKIKNITSYLGTFLGLLTFGVFLAVLYLMFLPEPSRPLLPGEFSLVLSGGEPLRYVAEQLTERFIPLVTAAAYLVLVCVVGGLYFLKETDLFSQNGGGGG